MLSALRVALQISFLNKVGTASSNLFLINVENNDWDIKKKRENEAFRGVFGRDFALTTHQSRSERI